MIMGLKYTKLLYYTMGLVTILAGTYSCSSSTDPYKPYVGDKEIVYPQKIDTVLAYSCKNRVVFKIPKATDPLINKVGVFWNTGKDSVVVKVPAEKDTLKIEIKGLQREGKHIFNFYNYNKNGNKSKNIIKSISVYGDRYASTLINRFIESADIINGNLFIDWAEAGNEAVGTLVKYINRSSNEPDSIFTPIDSSQTVITNFKKEYIITYKTLYIPESTVIDTFPSPKDTL